MNKKRFERTLAKKELTKFSITRVVTKDIVTDTFQGIRNFFGLRLRGYEQVINKHTNELIAEANIKYKTTWFRFSINPMVQGSIMITIFGEGYPNE